jgi:glycosyltransferase involved in cell wall biosynthesis
MKILFITDNFPPELNAPATRTYEHTSVWEKMGAEITILTCFPNYPQGIIYPGYTNKLYSTEQLTPNIKVIRLWSYMSKNEGFVKRILDYISFGFMAFWAGLFLKTDIIIATSPQFFTTTTGSLLGFLKRKPWVFELRDLWPESIRAVNAMKSSSKVLDWLEKLELYLYKSAKLIIPVTHSFKENLINRNINPDKIHVITNGANLALYQPMIKDLNLVSKFGLENKFVIGYTGTIGMAHGIEFIVDSFNEIQDESIALLIVGDGAEYGRIKSKIDSLQNPNIILSQSIPKNEVPNLISILDIALVNLIKSDTFKTVIPSKIFENASMGKPILAGLLGESKGIIEKYNAGLCFEPENKLDFIAKLKELKSNIELYKQSKSGALNLAKDFDRIKLAEKFYHILEKNVFNIKQS